MLSAAIFIPIVAAVVLAVLPSRVIGAHEPKRLQAATTLIAAVPLFLMVVTWLRFERTGAFELVEAVPWIPTLGVGYRVGVDGLSLPLAAMTALVFAVSVAYPVDLRGRPGPYFALMLFLEGLVVPRRWQGGAALLALATTVGSSVATWPLLGGTERLTFAETYARDATAAWAKWIVLAGTAVVIGLSVRWFERDPRHGEYYAVLLFSSLGAILLAGATDLKQFVMAMVLSSATGFVLIGYHRRSSPASEAAIKYYLIGAFTSASMLIGVAYLFGLAGSTTLPGLAQSPASGGLALVIGAALVIIALAFKTGAVPAHAWVPDVAQGGPAPAAAFVTSIPKVGGFLFLARLVLALPADAFDWRPMIAALAAVTMTLGNLAALWQDDVRRLLGWSAVSQTGYGLMAIVALGRSELALPSLLFFLLAYVLGNVAAFGVVVELRGRTALAAYAGLGRARPWLAGALAVSFLSFIGIPPLAGFVAKLALFAAAIEAGYAWLAVLAVVNTVVSIVYYARVLAPAYFGALGGPVPVLGRWAAVATLASAAAVVVTGLLAEPFLRAFAAAGLLPDR